MLASFSKRADGQIMGLEILSICLGISTFAKEISGRNVVIWSDNKGAEHATSKGEALVGAACLEARVCDGVFWQVLPRSLTTGH